VFPPVVAHLMADIGEFAAKMGEAEALQAKVTQSGAASWKSAGKQMMTTGGIMAAAAGAVAAETIHMASEFDAYMERVHTQAGASQHEVDSLKQSVLNLAMATGQGPEKLAEALYHVESVGYRGKVAMDVLTQSAHLAAISGANLDDTTYGLTSVMQTFGAKAGEASKYAALFNATVGAGDMQMEAFNRAVGTGFYSVAQTFGISAQSASGALAFMTDRGAHADEAATRLRMTIALLAAPSQKATTVLHSLGLTSESVGKAQHTVNGILKASHVTYSQLATDLKKPDGFYVALKHLQKGLEDSGLSAEAANAQLSHAFGGGKSDASILAMLNNLDTLKQKYEAVGKGMGSLAESYAASQRTASNQMERFKATAQALGIEIGHALMPYALKLLGWLRDVAQWIATHEGAVKALAALIGVTLVAGLILATAGAIAFAAATIEIWGPIALIIVGIMALVAQVVFLWTHWRQIWGWIVDHAKQVAAWLGQVWDKVKAKAVEVWNGILDWIRGVWKKIAGWLDSAWHTVTDPIVQAWNWLKSTTVRIWNAILDWLKKWWPLLLIIFMPVIAVVMAIWNHFHQAIFDTVVNWWNNVLGWLQTAWTWITDHATAAWNLFYEYVVAPVIRAANAVHRWVLWLTGKISAGFREILAWVVRQWNRFYAAVIDPVVRAYHAADQWLRAMWKSITGWFTRTHDDVVRTVSGWYNIGANIVQGVVQGIEDWASWAWGKVEDFANGLLSAAKSFLGINSPSRLFRDTVGRAIPEGVGVGVDLHARLATNPVMDLASKLHAVGQVAMSPSLSMPGLSQSVGFAVTAAAQVPQPVIHVHTHVVAEVDKRVLFKTTQTEALRYGQRNSAAAFSQ
jgi:TP901 family phage tail tape measure protein